MHNCVRISTREEKDTQKERIEAPKAESWSNIVAVMETLEMLCDYTNLVFFVNTECIVVDTL